MRSSTLACILALCAAVSGLESPPRGLDLDLVGTSSAVLGTNQLTGASSSSATQAVSCKAGQYYWGVWGGRHYCVRCPAGTSSVGCVNCRPDPQKTSCFAMGASNCAKGRFFDAKAAKPGCSDCPEGRWQSQAGKSLCYGCPAGMYQPRKGLWSCYWCPKGQYRAAASGDGASCSKCNSCAGGQYGITSKTGSTSASSCSCSQCDIGKYTPSGHTSCYNCPTGRFSPKKGMYTCYHCTAGQYNAAAGQGKCERCPKGQFQAAKGKTTCAACPAGKTASASGVTCTAGAPKVVYNAFFGFGAADATPPPGWKLATLAQLNYYKVPLAYSYAQNNGFKRLSSWKGTNCCMKLAGNTMLWTGSSASSGTFVYPASSDGKSLQCNPATGYTASNYRIYGRMYSTERASAAISPKTTFMSKKASGFCAKGSGSPGIFIKLVPAKEPKCPKLYIDYGDIRVCVVDDKLDVTPTTDFTVSFAVYNWRQSVAAAKAGWVLLDHNKVKQLAPLIAKDYEQRGGFTPIAGWAGAGCCFTVAGGYRLTADQLSFVYPLGADGRGLCKARNVFLGGAPVKVGFHSKGKWAPLDGVSSLFAANPQKTGLCARTAHEANPGIYMKRVSGKVVHSPLCAFEDSAKTIRLCLAVATKFPTPAPTPAVTLFPTRFPTPAPTVPPTMSPTKTPTQAPTLSPTEAPTEAPTKAPTRYPTRTPTPKITPSPTPAPTPFPTAFPTPAPTPCPQVRCVAQIPHGCHRRFTKDVDPRGCPLEPCGVLECPKVHCQVSQWSSWTRCSKTCGGGHQVRFRHIVEMPVNGGKECPELHTMQGCALAPCKVNCLVSQWGQWSTCSSSCGVGSRKRERQLLRLAANGGTCSHALRESELCRAPNGCPIHCAVSEWGAWGACTKTCGDAKQMRSRTITVYPKNDGMGCPRLSNVRSCVGSKPCVEDCKLGAWATWNKCSVTCGVGMRLRRRKALQQAQNGGKKCQKDDLIQKDLCRQRPCPIHCAIGLWGAWSKCDANCKQGAATAFGQRTRKRKINTTAAHGGKDCSLHQLEQTEACEIKECPVDCVLSSWSTWSACDKSCGASVQTRYREVVTQPQFNGFKCDKLHDKKPCRKDACPVDCLLHSWGSWGKCSKTCGRGTQYRSRGIVHSAINGGKACAATKEPRYCNTKPCPVHCKHSEWSSYSLCSRTCGTGTHVKTRTIVVKPAHGGEQCGQLVATKLCNRQDCPVDCKLTEWGTWDRCTKSCGSGQTLRRRSEERAAVAGGKKCGALTEARDCNTMPCAVDCVTDSWSAWSTCSATCMQGTQVRTRNIIVDVIGNGKHCPPTRETQICNDGPCPVHCRVTAFSPWSTCSQTCGGGSQSRHRRVVSRAQHGGRVCPFLDETRPCEVQECPTDCVLHAWTSWSQCTRSCGTGISARLRAVAQAPKHGGKICKSRREEKACNTQHCPIDCLEGNWQAWGPCSNPTTQAKLKCGKGQRRRTREVLRADFYGGKKCQNDIGYMPCNLGPCPVDCIMSSWPKHWSPCDKQCGGGTQTQARKILRPAQHGGQECPSVYQTRACNTRPCKVNCAVSWWGGWGECSMSCGNGRQFRNRIVTTLPAHGGLECPKELTQSQPCSNGPCPEHCETSPFSPWSSCTKTCGGGSQSRSRSITKERGAGGNVCPFLTEQQACKQQPCPKDCLIDSWGPWSACTQTCGGGKRTRSRDVLVAPSYGGARCPSRKQTVTCHDVLCPVDCVVSAWSEWSQCTATCGSGSQVRGRKIVVPQTGSGAACGVLQQMQSCFTQACPIDCTLSRWSAWSECTKSCSFGFTTRMRSVKVAAKFGGKVCAPTTENMKCNEFHKCPVDCKMSRWGAWSPCPATCGSAVMHMRTRRVLEQRVAPGMRCGALTNTRVCAPGPCPVHCTVSAWSKWAPCDKSCGGGRRSRQRKVIKHALHGGFECPLTRKEEACNEAPCQVDCVVSAWLSAGSCSVTCGGGVLRRTRKILTPPLHGGKGCPPTEDDVACNETPCPIDCSMSLWGKWTKCSVTCALGQQTRARSIKRESAFGGKACPTALRERVGCNKGPCPVHCKTSDWSAFSRCTQTCGKSGKKTRTRSVVRYDKHGGHVCPELAETVNCGRMPCPVDCVTAPWTTWSSCSKTCGAGGKQTRTRAVLRPSLHGGKSCGKLEQHMGCVVHVDCPVHCEVSQWGHWGSCSVTCNKGHERRERSVLTAAANLGSPCPALYELRDCNKKACPVPCTYELWSSWSACDATCGAGVQTRTRGILAHARNGGMPCGTTRQAQNCNAGRCPIDCRFSPWQAWGACSRTCGQGVQRRVRNVVQLPLWGGHGCGVHEEQRLCTVRDCPATPCNPKPVQNARTHPSLCPQWKKVASMTGGDLARIPKDTEISPVGVYMISDGHDGSGNRLYIKDDAVVFNGIHHWQSTAKERVQCATSCHRGCDAKWRNTGAVGYRHKDGSVCDPIGVGNHICGVRSGWIMWHNGATYGNGPCKVPGATSFGRAGLQHLFACIAAQPKVTAKWTEWSACSKTCGVGTQTRTRTDTGCGPEKQTQSCQDQKCPVECVHDTWGQWSPCSKTCGGGIQKRSRRIVTPAQYGALPCSSTSESRACAVETCPANCIPNPWGKWSVCSVTCGAGKQTRKRAVSAKKQGSGTCGATVQTQDCELAPCAGDCIVGNWKDWSSCSRTCGVGVQKRTRMITRPPTSAGKKCPQVEQIRTCTRPDCPVHCAVDKWSKWSACTKTCGDGTQTRKRVIKHHASNGGNMCPSTIQTQDCNVKQCPQHCEHSQWSTWTPCSTTCGRGVQKRDRGIVIEAANGGRACGATHQQQDCVQAPCPTHCALAPWGAWSACTKTCGPGTQYRTRAVSTQARAGGRSCGATRQTQDCQYMDVCPTDCLATQWDSWGACSATCGTGMQKRKRTVARMPAHGGKGCPALSEARSCNAERPCPVHCVWGSFGAWDSCAPDLSAGQGCVRTRRRIALKQGAHGGRLCEAKARTQEEPCTCPIHCSHTAWNEWTVCTKTCGWGEQTRSRGIKVQPQFGGRDCDALMQSRSCKMRSCPVDCKLGGWQAWGSCSASCGSGTQQRVRTVIALGQFGGVPCPHTKEVQDCKLRECPVHCMPSDWGSWSSCTVSCGRGSQHRTRNIAVTAKYGGLPCGRLHEARLCLRPSCPVHCKLHPWGKWSTCSTTCGVGKQTRRRAVKVKAQHGGTECAQTSLEQACDLGPCPEDCHVGQWGAWSACDKTCGASARQYSLRNVLKIAEEGGKPCPAIKKTRQCAGLAPCPVHCAVGSWGQFGPCSKSCGVGHKRRSRRITQVAQHGGNDCPSLLDQHSCHVRDCPQDCKMTQWASWGKCQPTWHSPCAQVRQRKIASAPVNGGKECGRVEVWRKCNSAKCTVPKASGCDKVRCEYVNDKFGRGHVRVFHDKNEPQGMRHTCRKLTHYHLGKHLGSDKARKPVLHEHGTYVSRCDCMCYDDETGRRAAAAQKQGPFNGKAWLVGGGARTANPAMAFANAAA